MNVFRRSHVILLLIAIVLLAATFFRPSLTFVRASYKYVFVYDISQSMNVADIPGKEGVISRLDYAKEATLQSLKKLPCGTEAGLALFTGHRAYLLITPLEICDNYREFSAILNNINWDMTWKAKSEIAKGIHKSIRLLTHLEENTRLVFFTDGHESPPIDPNLPPRFPGKAGEIKGVVVGVGGDQLVPIPKLDSAGELLGHWTEEEVEQINAYAAPNENADQGYATPGSEHLSSLREGYLKEIAEKTGLLYGRLENASDLTDQIKHKSLRIPSEQQTDMRWFFALAALIAFITTLLMDPVKRYFQRN